MTTKEQLINQHILEYENRLKHIDRLLEQAQLDSQTLAEQAEHEQELKEIKSKRDELVNYVNSVKTMSVEHWEKDEIDMAGPMGVWDAVALQIEKLIEGKKHRK